MKKLFLVIWALLSVSFTAAALRELWLDPSVANGFFLLLVGYYIVCFFASSVPPSCPGVCWVRIDGAAIGCV